jgi:hypothetical protein
MAELRAQSSAEILETITAKIASIDGISTADAFALGSLVRQYGTVCGGESAKTVIETMIDVKKTAQSWMSDAGG